MQSLDCYKKMKWKAQSIFAKFFEHIDRFRYHLFQKNLPQCRSCLAKTNATFFSFFQENTNRIILLAKEKEDSHDGRSQIAQSYLQKKKKTAMMEDNAITIRSFESGEAYKHVFFDVNKLSHLELFCILFQIF